MKPASASRVRSSAARSRGRADPCLAALEIKAQHGFSYWDSAIIAAARALGCQELFSEDLSHGQQIGSLTIVNPFR
jgi:predicted nucleic acid-binding protein